MLSKRVGLALLLTPASCFEFNTPEDIKLMNENIRGFLTDYEQAEQLERLDGTPNNLKATGTYPCIFKLGENFYDYTLFKLASQ